MANVAQLVLKVVGVDQTSGMLKGVSGQAQGAGNVMGGVLKAGAIAGGAALGGVAAASIQTGLAFDKAYDTIKVGTGATGQALKDLEGDMKAVFGRVPTDMQSASTAIADLNTRTGATGETLQGMAEQALNLSRLTGTDLAGNIKEVTRVTGDWGIDAEGTSLAMDKLFQVSQATGPPVAEIGRLMVQYGAPLRQMGFDFDDAAAMMGKFQQEGVNTELVMGSLRIGLIKLSEEGEPIPEAFARITDEIKNAGSTAEANTLAVEIFGARAGPDMAAAIREGRFEIEDLVGVLGDSEGAISDTAEATDDWKEKWVLLRNKAQLALEPLGKIAPIVGPMSPMIMRMGPAFVAMGTAMGGLATRQLPQLLPKLGALATSLGPMGLAGVAAVAGAALAYKFVPGVDDAVGAVGKFLGITKEAPGYIKRLEDSLKELDDQVRRNLLTEEEAAEERIKVYAQSLIDLQEEAEETRERLGLWGQGVEDINEGVGRSAVDLVKEMQAEGARVHEIYRALEEAGIDWKDTTVQEVLEPQLIKWLEYKNTLVNDVWEKVKTASEETTRLMKEDMGGLATRTEEDTQRIKDAIGGIAPSVGQSFEEWQKEVAEMYAAHVNFESNLNTIYKALADAGVENVEDIVRGLQEGGPQMAQAAMNMLKEGGPQAIETFRLTGEYTNAVEAVGGGDIVAELDAHKQAMFDKAVEAAQELVRGLKFGVEASAPDVAASMMILRSQVEHSLEGSPELFTYDLGGRLVTEFADGIRRGWDENGALIGKYVTLWGDAIKGIFETSGKIAAVGYTQELVRMLIDEGFPEIAGAMKKVFLQISGIGAAQAESAGQEAAGAMATGFTTELWGKYLGLWSQAIEGIYQEAGLHAAGSYAAALCKMLVEEGHPKIAAEIGKLFKAITGYSALGGEESAREMVYGLTGELENLTPSTVSDIESSLRLGFQTLAASSKESGKAVAGWTMTGIWQGFYEDFPTWAAKIAEIIYDELKEALGVSSPAKAMIPLGVAAGEGYTVGFQQALSPGGPTAAVPTGGGGWAPQPREVHIHVGERGIFLGERREFEALVEQIWPEIRRRFS